MGGVWERAIRSVRSIVSSILLGHGRKLTDELLATFMCEAESIVNSRPLTVDNIDDPTSSVLTPNHILTMKPCVLAAPPGVFDQTDEYTRKRWRTVQLFAERFWTRWRKEYVQSLQHRQKWTSEKRNFEVGDVVLFKEDNAARNHWPLGRVTEVRKGNDGLVRSVLVRTSTHKSDLERPIAKLVLLVEHDRATGGGV